MKSLKSQASAPCLPSVPSLVVGTCMSLCSGSIYGFGVFSLELKRHYHLSTRDLELIYSMGATGQYLGILGGMLYDAAGPNLTALVGAVLAFSGYCGFALCLDVLSSSPSALLLGFCYFLAGQGSVAMYYSALFTNFNNFHAEHRGRIVGLLASAYGLSAAFIGLLFETFFGPQRLIPFLYCLAALLGSAALSGALLLRKRPLVAPAQPTSPVDKALVAPSDSVTLPPADEETSTDAGSVNGSVAAVQNGADRHSGDEVGKTAAGRVFRWLTGKMRRYHKLPSGEITPPAGSPTAADGGGGGGLSPTRVGWPRLRATPPASPVMFEGRDGDKGGGEEAADESRRRGGGTAAHAHAQMAIKQGPQQQQGAEGAASHQEPHHHTATFNDKMRMVLSADMLMLGAYFCVVQGCCSMVIGNASLLSHSYGYSESARFELVKLLSYFNCAGRFVGGLLLDGCRSVVVTAFHFVLGSVLFIIAQISLVVDALRDPPGSSLAACISLVGLVYGMNFSYTPVFITETFGNNSLGFLFGTLVSFLSLFATVFNLIAGTFYDVFADKLEGDTIVLEPASSSLAAPAAAGSSSSNLTDREAALVMQKMSNQATNDTSSGAVPSLQQGSDPTGANLECMGSKCFLYADLVGLGSGIIACAFALRLWCRSMAKKRREERRKHTRRISVQQQQQQQQQRRAGTSRGGEHSRELHSV